MIKDAESHADEDRRRRNEAEVRNKADTLVYQTEKLLREHGDKITGDERAEVDAKMAALKTELEGSDLDRIKGATEALMNASQQFSQRLYEQASTGGTSTNANADAAGSADDDIVDAEIVDEGA